MRPPEGTAQPARARCPATMPRGRRSCEKQHVEPVVGKGLDQAIGRRVIDRRLGRFCAENLLGKREHLRSGRRSTRSEIIHVILQYNRARVPLGKPLVDGLALCRVAARSCEWADTYDDRRRAERGLWRHASGPAAGGGGLAGGTRRLLGRPDHVLEAGRLACRRLLAESRHAVRRSPSLAPRAR
eukprot:scaffold56425_cov71-Phaeocystis_antarctica.AAC.1